MTRPREATVRNLQELYTVAVGVALAVGVGQLIDQGTPRLIEWPRIPVFIAFLVTIVPFYHGAMRHLDDVYVVNGGSGVREGALLSDFFLLFIEACLFFIVAGLIPTARAAAWSLVALLAFDAIWGLAVHLLFSRRRERWAEVSWVVINLITVPILAAALLLTSQADNEEQLAAGIIAGGALLRTVADYRFSWAFYFPP